MRGGKERRPPSTVFGEFSVVPVPREFHSAARSLGVQPGERQHAPRFAGRSWSCHNSPSRPATGATQPVFSIHQNKESREGDLMYSIEIFSMFFHPMMD